VFRFRTLLLIVTSSIDFAMHVVGNVVALSEDVRH
jgi:hypothetical protein